MDDVSIGDVKGAFSPAKEIRNPEMFAGRRKEMEDGVMALLNEGGFIVVHGLRGVGKTSIARQIKNIAEGDDTLPKMMGIKRIMPEGGFRYKVQYISCDVFVRDTVDLIERILFPDEENESLFSLTKTGNRKVEEIKEIFEGKGNLNLPGVGGLSGGKTTEKISSEETSDNLIQNFREVLNLLKKDLHSKYDGVLILIDEFDTIKDKSGFSSIVKTCSSDFVKFGVVGIANNIGELIGDHQSIGRQIDEIKVPTMPKYQLMKILGKAEYVVENQISFTNEAKEEIAKMSEGFPYFTHLMGEEAMVSAFKNKQKQIDVDSVSAVSEKISEGKLKTNYEGLYHDSVKQSAQREMLLKMFAEEDRNEIHTKEVYEQAKEMGISNPSQLMKELTMGEKGSGVLKKVRPRYYRFTDPVFKVYSRKRDWKFDNSGAS
ncbi:ATP-binding protein [Salinibacter ruber]|jgi:Cdc6-like AAA superfamily ATPase|uniref:ATP-binding protein n=1 Tax=Salinibacter ruber TaxID=146919 RepID=UPI000DD9D9A6|nr:ATP-binding protein [Salinibacter ruber]MCS4135119.1 Cdc6-like AAA superfamily ATPase [Salinibacter ruber]MCS4221280.1 Cdc6-like AAA superfamily ATPase [Salinibacter ruber]